MRNRTVPLSGILLLVSSPVSADVICDKEPPLKPLRCVCGKITDQTGEPILGVSVRVLKDGREVATVKTGEDGKFIFDELKAGDYELNAQAPSFRSFRSAIVIVKPEKKCRRGLGILLEVGGETCGSRVIKQ